MIYSQAAAAAAHLYFAAAITISILAVALAATAIIIALSIHNERRCKQQQKMQRSFFLGLQNRENLYNQDKMSVRPSWKGAQNRI